MLWKTGDAKECKQVTGSSEMKIWSTFKKHQWTLGWKPEAQAARYQKAPSREGVLLAAPR